MRVYESQRGVDSAPTWYTVRIMKDVDPDLEKADFVKVTGKLKCDFSCRGKASRPAPCSSSLSASKLAKPAATHKDTERRSRSHTATLRGCFLLPRVPQFKWASHDAAGMPAEPNPIAACANFDRREAPGRAHWRRHPIDCGARDSRRLSVVRYQSNTRSLAQLESREGKKRSLEEVLLETEWMCLLPEISKERVLADARDRTFQPRETVAHCGQVSDAWIGVVSGLLKVSSQTSTGRTVMFAAVPDGSWVGEGSVIKREPRKYEILALRESRVISIPRPTFMWLLDTSVEFCQHVIGYLNERTGQFISMLEVSRISDPVARTAGTILILFNPILYKKVGPLLDISQGEIGELAGLSRATTNVALNKLKALNLINPQYGKILVMDVHKLRKFVEGKGGEEAAN